MSEKKILNKMRARNARPYNVTKESNCALYCCTVGARIARPLSEFVQHLGLTYLLGKKTRIPAVAEIRVFLGNGAPLGLGD